MHRVRTIIKYTDDRRMTAAADWLRCNYQRLILSVLPPGRLLHNNVTIIRCFIDTASLVMTARRRCFYMWIAK